MQSDDLHRGLEQDARQVAERVPEKLSVPELAALIESVKRFKADHGLSHAQIGRRIGYSRSVVASFLAGRYDGDLEKLAGKLVWMMNSEARKQRRDKGEAFVSTTVARRIGTLIVQTEAFSDAEGRIGVIIGDGGHGKSHCLRQYAEADKNAVYIAYDDCMTMTRLFAEIARAVRLPSAGSLAAVTARLVKGLRDRRVIVLIDEASSLRVRDLNRLRQVLVIKARCPVILAGNADLLKTLQDPGYRDGHASLDQFNSRLMSILNLDEVAGDDDGGLYTAEDIRALYEYGGIVLKSDAVETFRRICKTPRTGRLRTCGHICSALHMSPTIAERGYIDGPAILSAVDQLALPIRDWLPMAYRQVRQQEEREAAAWAG